MTQLDFSTITTDDLLQVIPSTETKEWEFKAASAFDPKQFGDFKKRKLGKIVSSFANSGGGYLLLGKRDNVDVFEHIPTHEGRTRMEDHLSLLISQSVVPHYRNFEIHRVPISGRSGESVLVVRFDDSPMAPHQSVSDTNYFYRLPGHCVPAPHFYIELIRGRYTKAVLSLESPTFSVSIPYSVLDMKNTGGFRLHLDATFTVKNTSLQVARPCAIRVIGVGVKETWYVGNGISDWLQDGSLFTNDTETLFPSLCQSFQVEFDAYITRSGSPEWQDFLPAWQSLAFTVQPFSQNYVGEPQLYRPSEMLAPHESLLANAFADRLQEEGKLKASMAKSAERLSQAFSNVPSSLFFGR